MACWLVFCTTQVNPSVVEKFQEQSNIGAIVPEDIWILQESSEGGVCGPYLTCPVAPFTTDFEDATLESIQSWVLNNVEEKIESPDIFDNSLSPHTFVILDKRSIEDDTCIICHRFSSPVPGCEGQEWTSKTRIYEWKSWRVKFLVAWHTCSDLWFKDEYFLEMLPEGRYIYIDDNGVLQRPDVENNTSEFPDLEYRQPYGVPIENLTLEVITLVDKVEEK